MKQLINRFLAMTISGFKGGIQAAVLEVAGFRRTE